MQIRLSSEARGLLTVYGPSLLLSFGTGMIVPAVPLLASTYGVSVGLAAQVVTAQIIGRLLFVLPAGAVVDRTGPKAAMLAGPALLVIAAVAAGFAPSFPFLLGAMFFQGAGSNLWQIGREVAVINLVKADQRGRAMSAFFGVSQVGATLGPVLGGVVTDLLGFRALFLTYALIGCGVMCVSLLYQEIKSSRPRSTSSLFDFGRLSDLDPVFRATFLVLVFATFCMMLRMTVFSSMMPLYVGAQLGYSATTVGGLFGLVGVVGLLMVIPAGFLSDKVGRKAATVPAAALTGLSFFLFGVGGSLPLLIVAAAINGLGIGFASGSMTTSTFDIAPEGQLARFQSLRRFSAELGTLTGPPLAGSVASFLSPKDVFLFFTPPYAVSAALLAFVARETHPGRRRSEPQLVAQPSLTKPS